MLRRSNIIEDIVRNFFNETPLRYWTKKDAERYRERARSSIKNELDSREKGVSTNPPPLVNGQREARRYVQTNGSVLNPGSEARISGETFGNRRTRLAAVPET